MSWQANADGKYVSLQQKHEDQIRQQRIADSFRRHAIREYYQDSVGLSHQIEKNERSAEGCRNLHRARTMASVTWSELARSCALNIDSSPCQICEILIKALQKS